jgi:hypothetical protein
LITQLCYRSNECRGRHCVGISEACVAPLRWGSSNIVVPACVCLWKHVPNHLMFRLC